MKKILLSIAAVLCCMAFRSAAQTPNPLPSPYAGTFVNYVRTWTATAPEQSATNLIVRPLTDVKQTTDYTDGFGRPIETVQKNASPLGNDQVSVHTYNTLGQEQFGYLPFTSNVVDPEDQPADGNFKVDAFQQQQAFYNGLWSAQPGETNIGSGNQNWAYGQTNFETSPLNRTLNTFSPGAKWVGTAGAGTPHDHVQQDEVNTAADSVEIWNIGPWSISNPETNILPASGGTYGAGQLYKQVITDDQGMQSIVYTDMYGQEILKKVQLWPTPASGHSGWLCTYSVYDDHGNKRFLITPNLVTQMNMSGSWSISQTQADLLCYRFEYDLLGRLVVQKKPGTPTGSQGEIWMVYDARNRLVLSQNGDMRPSSQWTCHLYDGLDRLVMTGTITYSGTLSQLQQAVTTQTQANTSGTVSGATPPSIPGNLVLTLPSETGTWQAAQSITMEPGFSTAASTTFVAQISPQTTTSVNNTMVVNASPIPSGSTFSPLAAVFYDNYDWMSTSGAPLNATLNYGQTSGYFTTSYNTAPTYAQPITQSQQIQGGVTGEMAQNLGQTSQNLYSLNIYDEFGHVIQMQSTNVTGGTDFTTTQYEWNGKPLGKLQTNNYVSTTNPQTHQVYSAATYDAMNRLISVSTSVSSTINGVAVSSPATTLFTNQYDELARLQKKTLGTNLESLTYEYNVRGWPLGINRAYVSGASTSNYFGLELGYDNPTSQAPNNAFLHPTFSGNLSGTVWKTKGDGVNRKYDFTYDDAYRMSSAAYLQNTSGTSWDNNTLNFSVNSLTYDPNGNLGSMRQYGFAQGASNPIDELQYNYLNGNGSGNQLQNVVDTANVTNSTLGDFHYAATSKSNTAVDYTYDADGNMITDNNRNISGITYTSYLDLPQAINTTNEGTVQYWYDATGNKLKKIVTQNTTINGSATTITSTTTYIPGGFEYKTVNYTGAAASMSTTDVLQFIGTEEGRIRFIPALGNVPASFVHDYMIKDHLGNVRMGLTDQVQQDIYPAATGETQSYNGGEAQSYEAQYYSFSSSDWIPTSNLSPWFLNIAGNSSGYNNENNNGTPTNAVDPYSNVTATSQMVYQLCGNTANDPTGDRFGLGMTLKVMSGDVINIYGKSFWHNPSPTLPSGSYPVSAVLTSLLSAFAGSPALASPEGRAILDGSSLNTSATSSLLMPQMNNSSSQSGFPNAPYAGISWIIFDDRLNPISVGFNPVSQTTDNIVNHSIAVSIPQNGYIYVYASNQSNLNVYFDNLQVTQTRGPILEETHYYPAGVAMAAISDRAWNKEPNYFHLQGKEMQDQEWYDGTGLEEYDFGARHYDPQLGVWHAQDPAGQFASPYMAMADNWPNATDKNGEWAGWDDAIVTGIGFLVGYVSYGLEHGNWGGKALENGGIDAIMFEAGYLTGGGGLSCDVFTGAGMGGAGSIPAALSFSMGAAATSAVSSAFPSIPITNNLSVSPALAFGSNGIEAGLNLNYHSGNFSLGVGFSALGNNSRVSVGGGWDDGKLGFSYSWNHFYGQYSQNTGTIGIHSGDFYGSWENDRFGSIQSFDRWRTNAFQAGVKLQDGSMIALGSNFWTGMDNGHNPDNPMYYTEVEGENAPRQGAFYLTYTRDGVGVSLGIDDESWEHTVQNGMHDFLRTVFHTHDYYFPNLNTPTTVFFRFGTSNPFSSFY